MRKNTLTKLSTIACLAFLGASSIAYASQKTQAPDLNALAQYANIDKSLLDQAITEATYQQKIIDTMKKPYEGKPWHIYRNLFIIDKRIKEGVQFFLRHEQELLKAEKELGVAPQVICAIIGVETFYGQNMGSWKVLDALYTLGFHYPPREAYFSKEFANFVKLAQQEGWNLTDIKGSYAGAMGMGQFMPSSYLNYAIDFDKDGHINLFSNTTDAIGSVANYFKEHGWVHGLGVMYPAHTQNVNKTTLDRLMKLEWKLTPAQLSAAGVTTKVNLSANQNIRLYSFELADGTYDYQVALNNFNAITKYNKSPLYARAVYELSELIYQGYIQAKGNQGVNITPGGKRP